MKIRSFKNLDELAPHVERWNELAQGNPFRCWEWLENWCRHFGAEPWIIAGFDEIGLLVAAIPWVITRSAARGVVASFAGGGEVCSEYLGVLAAPQIADKAVSALAQWVSNASSAADRWDLIDLSAVDPKDTVTSALITALGAAGHRVCPREGFPCWRVDLAGDWKTHLSGLQKRHARRVASLTRTYLDTGRAVFFEATNAAELARGFEVLVDLHQRRWRGLGQAGCFASPRFLAFHREVMLRLLEQDVLRLSWLEVDGQPAAVRYDLHQAGVIYNYQSGLDPELIDHDPGKLIMVYALQRAIARGDRVHDFLRGDERYKALWGAKPYPTRAAHIISKRPTARLRHRAREILANAGGTAKKARVWAGATARRVLVAGV